MRISKIGWFGVLLSVAWGGSIAQARVNMLEPMSPGFDASIPETRLNQSAFLQVANGGQGGLDMTGVGYSISTPWARNGEWGGTWGFRSLDSNLGRDGSGLTDITLGAKKRIPSQWLNKAMKGVYELGASLPTGNPKKGLGSGGLGIMGNAGVTLPIRAVKGYAQAGLTLYTSGRSNTHWGNVLSYSAGAMYAIDTEWMVSSDLRFITHGRDKINGVRLPDAQQEAYLAPGGVWRPADLPFEAQGLLLLGLTGDSYDFGIQAGVRF